MSNQAEAIADAILNASVLGPATRIALRSGIDAGSERDLGGLGREALVRVITETLKNAKPNNNRPIDAVD